MICYIKLGMAKAEFEANHGSIAALQFGNLFDLMTGLITESEDERAWRDICARRGLDPHEALAALSKVPEA